MNTKLLLNGKKKKDCVTLLQTPEQLQLKLLSYCLKRQEGTFSLNFQTNMHETSLKNSEKVEFEQLPLHDNWANSICSRISCDTIKSHRSAVLRF